MSPRGALVLFLALALGGGLVIGYFTAPDEWYAALAKPVFNPPAWLFAPVWTVLYVLIAVAGWRVWRHARGGAAMKLWWAQLVLNFLWSPVFFAAHAIGAALGIIVLLLALIGSAAPRCANRSRRDRRSSGNARAAARGQRSCGNARAARRPTFQRERPRRRALDAGGATPRYRRRPSSAPSALRPSNAR